MTLFKRFILSLLIIGSLPVATFADKVAEMTADFEWFSQLGYRELKDLPFVRGVWGWSVSSKGEDPQRFEGFLLGDEKKAFRILDFNFTECVIPKEERFIARKPNHHEPADLGAYANELVAEVSSSDARFPTTMAGPHFLPRTNQFVVAWACHQKGLSNPAERLYTATRTNENYLFGYGANKQDHAAFRLQLERDIAHVEMWRIVADFSNPAITRIALMERLRAYPRRFPNSEYLARAKKLASNLEPMIAEDKARKPRTPEETARLSPGDKIEEWIFQLRDHNAQQYSQPGWVEVFNWDGKRTTVDYLAEAGEAAIPQLIEALGNRRPSRSVGYGRNFRFSHEILSIGDLSLAVIEKIAGRRFGQNQVLETSQGEDTTEAVHTKVIAWRKARQTKGEERELADATAEGNPQSPETGRKLLKHYPNAAEAAILAGIEAAKEGAIRQQMIRLLWRIKTNSVREFLQKEAAEGPFLGTRAIAGYQLAKQGLPDALLALAAEWKKIPVVVTQENRDGVELLMIVLAAADHPQAIDALAEDLRGRPMTTRRRVIELLDLKDRFNGLWQTGEPYSEKERTFSKATLTSVEKLLAEELQDTESMSVSTTRRDKISPRYRPCDHAALLLAEYWPKRYQFDFGAPFPLHERQRLACLNTWRKSRNLPPLPPLPDRPRVTSKASLKVAEVVFSNPPLKTPTALPFEKALRKTVNAALFFEIEAAFLAACEGQAPSGESGFVMEAIRENDGTGVTLVVEPAIRKALNEIPKRNWSLAFNALLGNEKKSFTTQWSLFTPDDPRVYKEYDLRRSVFERLASLPPDAPFRIRMELAPAQWDID